MERVLLFLSFPFGLVAVAAAVVSDTQLLQQLLPHGKDSGALFLQFFSSY